MAKEPFGRQAQPVKVVLDGDIADIQYWLPRLMRAAEFAGDVTQKITPVEFKIYPRANND